MRGTLAEWPFYAYSLSDGRWSEYTAAQGGGFGLDPAVDLINWNDAGLGLVVLVALAAELAQGAAVHEGSAGPAVGRSVATVLLVLFRDATLWRETVEVRAAGRAAAAAACC